MLTLKLDRNLLLLRHIAKRQRLTIDAHGAERKQSRDTKTERHADCRNRRLVLDWELVFLSFKRGLDACICSSQSVHYSCWTYSTRVHGKAFRLDVLDVQLAVDGYQRHGLIDDACTCYVAFLPVLSRLPYVHVTVL
jgi:hypothetical protein